MSFQMRAIHFNPFTWDNSSKKVKSSVISLDLQSANGTKINVSNLDNYIDVVIPITSPSPNTSNETEHYFLKPNKMSFRSYYAELADVPVSIKIGVQEKGVVIELFVKFGKRPTIKDFDHNFTVRSTCRNQTNDKQNGTSCVLEENSLTVVPSVSTNIPENEDHVLVMVVKDVHALESRIHLLKESLNWMFHSMIH